MRNLKFNISSVNTPLPAHNCFFLTIFTLPFFILFVSCAQKPKTNESVGEAVKPPIDTVQISPPFIFLQTGPPPPPLYENAQDIVSKKFKVNYIWAAGCIVTDKLNDSINRINTNTKLKLNLFYKRDVFSEIEKDISSEYHYLVDLDNYLRRTQKNQNNCILIYYAKKQKSYMAYYLFGMPSAKKLQYRIKSVLLIDSASNKIVSSEKKDEIQPYNLKELQND